MRARRYGNYVQPSIWPYYPKVSVFELLRNTAKRVQDRPFILHPRRVTFKELDVLTDKFATALAKLGIRKGHVVALFLWNSPEFIIAFYGALKAGAIITTLNPSHKKKATRYQLENSESTTVIIDDEQWPLIEAIKNELHKLENIIVVGNEYPETTSFKKLIDRYPPSSPDPRIVPQEDLAILQYTAGTTGLPKGCMLTHYNFVSNTLQKALFNNVGLQITGEDIFMAHLPLYHIYGMMEMMSVPIFLGSSIVIQRRFEPTDFLRLIERYKVTVLFTVMPVLTYYAKNPHLLKEYDISSLRIIGQGGTSIAIDVAKKFEELTGLTIVQLYGLSEASPATNANPICQVKLESVGPPIPDTEAVIVDLEDPTKRVQRGEVGELAVRGPQIMKGYWKEPEETAKVLTSDGWLLTGDIAKMDDDGFCYIVDRKKEIIKYKGFSIGPSELEAIIVEHQAVADCAVIGKPDPVAGEVAKAYVALKQGVKITKKELMEFVNEKVARYKRIHEVEIVPSIPRSLAGKVLRRVFCEKDERAGLT